MVKANKATESAHERCAAGRPVNLCDDVAYSPSWVNDFPVSSFC